MYYQTLLRVFYRQVYFVHSRLQDESLQVTISKLRVVSGLPGALYSICCLGVSTILESEKIVVMWPRNEIALT